MKLCNLINMFVLGLMCLPLDAASDNRGHQIYRVRCAICHDKLEYGVGLIGVLASKLADKKHAPDEVRTEIFHLLGHDGPDSELAVFLPGWIYALSNADKKLLANLLFEQINSEAGTNTTPPGDVSPLSDNTELGKWSYQGRCVACHGAQGKGDGKLSDVVKNPTPADLSVSHLSLDDIRKIIKFGGQGVGRSANMPSWGDELYDEEINALATYVMQLRPSPVE